MAAPAPPEPPAAQRARPCKLAGRLKLSRALMETLARAMGERAASEAGELHSNFESPTTLALQATKSAKSHVELAAGFRGKPAAALQALQARHQRCTHQNKHQPKQQQQQQQQQQQMQLPHLKIITSNRKSCLQKHSETSSRKKSSTDHAYFRLACDKQRECQQAIMIQAERNNKLTFDSNQAPSKEASLCDSARLLNAGDLQKCAKPTCCLVDRCCCSCKCFKRAEKSSLINNKLSKHHNLSKRKAVQFGYNETKLRISIRGGKFSRFKYNTLYSNGHQSKHHLLSRLANKPIIKTTKLECHLNKATIKRSKVKYCKFLIANYLNLNLPSSLAFNNSNFDYYYHDHFHDSPKLFIEKQQEQQIKHKQETRIINKVNTINEKKEDISNKTKQNFFKINNEFDKNLSSCSFLTSPNTIGIHNYNHHYHSSLKSNCSSIKNQVTEIEQNNQVTRENVDTCRNDKEKEEKEENIKYLLKLSDQKSKAPTEIIINITNNKNDNKRAKACNWKPTVICKNKRSRWALGGGRLRPALAAPGHCDSSGSLRPAGPMRMLWLAGALAALGFLLGTASGSEWGVGVASEPILAASSTAKTQSPMLNDELASAVLATMSTQRPSSGSNISGLATPAYADESGGVGAVDSQPPIQQQQQNYSSSQASLLDKLLDFGRLFLMSAIIVGDICGNSLVILSVCRHSKLRVTTNWFVVSLACADILVALFAMTFNASVIISGRWLFKPWVCDFWNSCDVLASTASILHLCCISIDRYIAIMRPLDYPMKITTRRVMYALCGVWISSALLSYIPIFTGIYTTAEHIKWLKDNPDQCEFVVNRVYAVVSSSISFWIPCCIMVFTYYRIYREATRQEKFIYKAQSILPAPLQNHHHHHHHHNQQQQSQHNHKNQSNNNRTNRQRRSKSMAVSSSAASGSSNEFKIKHLVKQQQEMLQRPTSNAIATTALNAPAGQPKPPTESEPLTTSSNVDINNNNNNNNENDDKSRQFCSGPKSLEVQAAGGQQQLANYQDDDEQNSDSGQSTPTKRSISKMKREHKAAKTLGIIMGVFILCWLPFFSWYTPQHICGHACDGMVPRGAVTLLFWIGYFNSTLNPIIYAYFNHEFRDAFKKTLQWIFCCCQDLKCLRVNRPNENQRYNCTYRSTQEIGLVSNG